MPRLSDELSRIWFSLHSLGSKISPLKDYWFGGRNNIKNTAIPTEWLGSKLGTAIVNFYKPLWLYVAIIICKWVDSKVNDYLF